MLLMIRLKISSDREVDRQNKIKLYKRLHELFLQLIMFSYRDKLTDIYSRICQNTCIKYNSDRIIYLYYTKKQEAKKWNTWVREESSKRALFLFPNLLVSYEVCTAAVCTSKFFYFVFNNYSNLLHTVECTATGTTILSPFLHSNLLNF